MALQDVQQPVSSPRFKSVDVLRGFDMFWIIGGAGIARALGKMDQNVVTGFITQQLTHKDWEGLHFYDVIYPLFLFLVGFSIVFSIDKHRGEQSRAVTVRRILRRGLMLFLFGFVYHGGLAAKWPDVRLSGVLQMIAACYVIAAIVYLYIGANWRRIAGMGAGLLLAYWALLTFAPFPDVVLDRANVERLAKQAGSRDPAAILALVPERQTGVYDAGYNFSNFVDFRYLPGKKVNVYYESQGVLSPLGATVICLAGILAALWLRREDILPKRKAAWLAVAGVVAIALGVLWSLQFPVVKKLWTSSFCLVTSGISALMLAGFYLVVDVWRIDRWCAPFLWLGTNSITIYLGYELIRFERISERLIGADIRAYLDTHVARGAGALLQALVGLALALALVRFLYNRRIFLRV